MWLEQMEKGVPRRRCLKRDKFVPLRWEEMSGGSEEATQRWQLLEEVREEKEGPGVPWDLILRPEWVRGH